MASKLINLPDEVDKALVDVNFEFALTGNPTKYQFMYVNGTNPYNPTYFDHCYYVFSTKEERALNSGKPNTFVESIHLVLDDISIFVDDIAQLKTISIAFLEDMLMTPYVQDNEFKNVITAMIKDYNDA